MFDEILLGAAVVYTAGNVDDAKKLYAAGAPFDLILLDHDLEDKHYEDPHATDDNTGTAFVQWLISNESPECPVIIHSYNPVGAQRMAYTLHDAGWTVQQQPFGMDLLNALKHMVRAT